MNNRIKHTIYILLTFCLYTALVFPSACKELPNLKLPGKDEHRDEFSTNRLPPATNPDNGGDVSTAEASIPTAESDITTQEDVATAEVTVFGLNPFGVATSEQWGGTPEETIEVPSQTVVYAKIRTPLLVKEKNKFTVAQSINPGTPLIMLEQYYATKEFLLIHTGKQKGYVKQSTVCLSRICIEPLRRGTVELYVQSKDIIVPQLQIKVTNLFDNPIQNLKIIARFYYKGEFIGEDEGFVAADIIGIKALPAGKYNILFFRPYYELPVGESISPENPVDVELLCALEGFTYEPCGKFKIEQDAY